MPNFFVRPERNVFLGLALNIQAADLRRAHAEEGETAVMVSVDKLLRRRRGLGENAEPAERGSPLEYGESACRDGGAAHAVEPVATGDEIAKELLRLVIFADAVARRSSREI